MLHLSLGISIVFLALTRCAAPKPEAFDGQERNKGGLLTNTSSGAYSAVYSAVRLRLDRKTSEQAPRDGKVVGQRKVLLRSHDDKSLPAQYPNTILHARGSKFGQLGIGDRPRCWICRHLCAGDAINRFACLIHFQDFGWACHLRGNQDPQRLGVVESSKRQQECLICREKKSRAWVPLPGVFQGFWLYLHRRTRKQPRPSSYTSCRQCLGGLYLSRRLYCLLAFRPS